MVSGCYLDWGTVTEVTPNGVCVQPYEEPIKPSNWNLFQYGRKSLLHFDSDGNGLEEEGTRECGAWHIDDMPFAEREALYEQRAKKVRKWRSMDCAHSEIGEHYYIEKCPICGCENPNYEPIAAKKRLESGCYLSGRSENDAMILRRRHVTRQQRVTFMRHAGIQSTTVYEYFMQLWKAFVKKYKTIIGASKRS